MGSLMQCIRSCLDSDENGHPLADQRQSIEQMTMDRVDTSSSRGRTRRPGCCDLAPPPWAQFWRNLQKQTYQHLETEPPRQVSSSSLLSRYDDDNSMQSLQKNGSKDFGNQSPLRTAETFDSSRDILTIRMEEIVLPGSALQHAMAMKMGETISQQIDDECVICMESFSEHNPRMPTLCGCGANKTYFHLPCLYQWREQSPDCPSCRQRISWEEF